MDGDIHLVGSSQNNKELIPVYQKTGFRENECLMFTVKEMIPLKTIICGKGYAVSSRGR